MEKPVQTDDPRHCEVCGIAVAPDAEWCPVCGVEMGQAYPQMETEQTWEIARTVSTVIEAELMAGRLRGHGIPAIVLSQVDSTRNFTVGDLAIAKIFVPSSFLDEAQRILATDADADEEWNEEIDD